MNCATKLLLSSLFFAFAKNLSPQSPEDADRLTTRALASIQQGDTATAHQLLAQALKASPNSPSANNALGNLLLSERSFADAMARFETVLAVDLHDPAARAGELGAATQLALQTRNAGDADGALLDLQHAREHLPDDPTLLFDLGVQAEQVRQLPIAQEALEAALKLRPRDAPTVYALARVELDRDHLVDAERHMRAYLVVHPEDATAHFGMGHLLERQQRIEDATAEFQRSIDLQPLQTESYYQLGQIALDAGDFDRAIPLFNKALTRDPHHGGALAGLGIIAYRRKDFTAARQQLTAATASAPAYQPAHYYLGLTLARIGEKSASVHELQIASDLATAQDPHNPSATRQKLESEPKP